MHSLADDRSIAIKKVDKDSYVVVWDREDYNAEAEKRDKNVYKKAKFKRKIFRTLLKQIMIFLNV